MSNPIYGVGHFYLLQFCLASFLQNRHKNFIMKYLIPFMILLLVSCNSYQEDVQFLGVEKVELGKISGKEANLKAYASFHNPNKRGGKLKEVDIDVILDGKVIGKVNHALTTKISGESDFTVPLDVKIDLTQIGLLNGLLSVFGGKKIKVNYKGKIKLSSFGYPIEVPVDDVAEFKM